MGKLKLDETMINRKSSIQAFLIIPTPFFKYHETSSKIENIHCAMQATTATVSTTCDKEVGLTGDIAEVSPKKSFIHGYVAVFSREHV